MKPGAVALVALLAVASAAPLAVAHGPAFEAAARDADDRLVEVALEGAPSPTAGAPLVLRVALDEGRRVDGVRATLVPHGGKPGTAFALEPDAQTPRASDHVARVVFPAAGDWLLRVEVSPDGARHEFPAHVYAASPWFPRFAEGESGVVVAGAAPREIHISVVDAQGRPASDLRAATVLLADASGAPVAVDARRVSPGVLAFAPPDAEGAYLAHVIAPELGLEEGARPPLGLLVAAPDETGVYAVEAETPGPAAWLVVAAVGCAAIAYRRRR